jgi:triosephosphate isomerase
VERRGRIRPDPLRGVRQAENIATLMAKQDIDGALVGGASLAADSFAKIVKFK